MDVRLRYYPRAHHPPLGDHEIHVWLATPDAGDFDPAAFLPLLSADERRRAETITAPESRRQFCAGRGILRTLLGQYTGTPAVEIPLAYSAHGKPHLAAEGSSAPLEFNVAHTHGMLAFAFCRYGPVGIDVEQIRSVEAIAVIVEHMFDEKEKAAFFRQPEKEKLRTFYRLWTRKESLGKAIGTGIGGQAAPGQAAAGRWMTMDWPLGASHHLAVTGVQGMFPPNIS